MRDLSDAEQEIIDTIDSQIAKLDRKLEPFNELIQERQRLRKAKAILLGESAGPRAGGGANTQLTADQVRHAFRESKERYLSVADLAKATGAPDSTVRSHLNRGKGTSYKKKGDNWRLIGGEEQSE